eukprot:1874917-Pyramimonas_sp.AAC.1
MLSLDFNAMKGPLFRFSRKPVLVVGGPAYQLKSYRQLAQNLRAILPRCPSVGASREICSVPCCGGISSSTLFSGIGRASAAGAGPGVP